MSKLDGKVAIVTGGGTGIGRAIALEFANEGADIVICGRTASHLEKVAAEINALGKHSLAITSDVSVKTQVHEMMQQAIDSFNKIDILVNNAAIARRGSLLQTTEDDWNCVIDTDLKSVFLCIQEAAKYMIEQRFGKIINISSIAGRGGALNDSPSYCVAKAGVIQLTKCAAFELGPFGINVNAIAPGFTMTPMVRGGRTPQALEEIIGRRKKSAVLGRIGAPEDIAKSAVFLASTDSSFISGQVIPVDGGRFDRM